MIYKITIKHMPRNNFAKAEVGMSIEISSKQLSSFFGNYINPFKVQNNDDIKAIRNAFIYLDPALEDNGRFHHDIKFTPQVTDY